MTFSRKIALLGGGSILLMAVAAGFSYGYVNEQLVVADDAAATVRNLQASPGLFQAGVCGWVLILLLDLLAAWALYRYLRPVNQAASLLMGVLRVVYAIILALGISHLVVA
ncbi:MAG: DUF4386 domain-containing protein, partial [Lewinella sp.]|nr:DUF4386 domain-containing protein [Lewinella sp.]